MTPIKANQIDGQGEKTCLICGESGYADWNEHTKSESCQLSAAKLSIHIADDRKMCPWCGTARGLKKLSSCRVAEHKKRLAYCREIVAKAGSGSEVRA